MYGMGEVRPQSGITGEKIDPRNNKQQQQDPYWDSQHNYQIWWGARKQLRVMGAVNINPGLLQGNNMMERVYMLGKARYGVRIMNVYTKY